MPFAPTSILSSKWSRRKNKNWKNSIKSEVERLEHLSGISAEEAKDRLGRIFEGRSQDAGQPLISTTLWTNAKMTANKEAKRIVIQDVSNG